MNPVTGRTYRGINALALAMSPRAFGGDPRWMSYRQAAARGWQVRKGEKGAIVFFYKKLEIRSDDEDRANASRSCAPMSSSTLRSSTESPSLASPRRRSQSPSGSRTRISSSKQAASASQIGGDRAFYRPSIDHIQMPPDEAFASPPDWARDDPA